MKEIQVGIIGGTRGMGKWFADYLLAQGCSVHVTGRSSGMTKAEMAAACQVVVVSVPISVTVNIIGEIGPLLPEESLLMDLTSLKAASVAAMVEYSAAEVIGCHPLFGPQVASLKNQHIVLCPVRSVKWLPWLKEILEKGGALLAETTPEKHDELMSVVQGLNHFNTIMMGLVLSKIAAPIVQIAPFTTPLFNEKLNMVEKIFTDNQQLYAEIICHNKMMAGVMPMYEQMIGEVKSFVLQGDAEGLTKLLQQGAERLWPQSQYTRTGARCAVPRFSVNLNPA
jgi:prephenate dehydrogenase